MGKGGGCIPSKIKPPRVSTPDDGAPAPQPQRHSKPSPIETLIKTAPILQDHPPPQYLRIFIVFYSMYGHVETLARTIKKGADSIEGVEGVLYRVPETLPPETLKQMKVPVKDSEIPIISPEELADADGLLFGFPARYGSMAAQMKAFFDSTGRLWKEQKLAGIPAGFFVGTGTQGGGQETTAWTAITQLAHHGMLFVPIGYTFGSGAGMMGMDVIHGGSPYGAGLISGDGTREPSEVELAIAEHHGKYMAMIVKRLGKPCSSKH